MKIEIWLDTTNGLKDGGIEPDTPITVRLKDCRLERALNLILDDLSLTWTIHNDVLFITSPQRANSEQFLDTRVYDVADLVVYQDRRVHRVDDYKALIATITSTSRPSCWSENGGSGSIHGASLGTAKVLVISQTRAMHQELATLLEQIRDVAANFLNLIGHRNHA